LRLDDRCQPHCGQISSQGDTCAPSWLVNLPVPLLWARFALRLDGTAV